jgi:hypothetical protein
MPTVAVAGGLGDLGKIIVEAIVELKRHKVFILSRKVPSILSCSQFVI